MARVLVVEDERVVAWHLQMTLERLGHTVVERADSGIKAIQAAQAIKPDVVIMDICLKGNIDGVEAAEQIYQSFDIPIIYVTAYSDNNTLQRAKLSSPYGYLLKPLRAQDLKSTIEITLYRHQLEQTTRNNQQQIQNNLTEQLQQVSAQFSTGIVCIHVLQKLIHWINFDSDEAQLLQALLQELGQALSANYCWLAFYDEGQVSSSPLRGRATVAYEYVEDGLRNFSSLIGQAVDLQTYSDFYHHLAQKKFWLSPSPTLLPVPFQALLSYGSQLLIFPLYDEQTVTGEIGIVLEDQQFWSEQQTELIAEVMGQTTIALHQIYVDRPLQTQDQVTSLDSLKDGFLSSISHELRTPLTNMRMAVEMMQQIASSLRNADTNPETQQNNEILWQRMDRYLQVLQEEWQQEFALISDLLDFRNMGSLDEPLQFAPLNLQQWLPQIIHRFIPQAIKQRQSLTWEIEPSITTVITHSPSLERILIELISNALKYTPAGQKSLSPHSRPNRRLNWLSPIRESAFRSQNRSEFFNPFIASLISIPGTTAELDWVWL